MGVTSKLVLAFVTLILGAVLIGVIATNGLVVSTLTHVTSNESLDISSVRIDDGDIGASKVLLVNAYDNDSWQAENSDCDIVIVDYFLNASNRLTVTTHYTHDGNGGITIVNGTLTADVVSNNDTVVVGYSYCDEDYLNLGWGRTLVNLVSGFFALAILGTSLGLFYSVAKDTGII